jgi:putative transposase
MTPEQVHYGLAQKVYEDRCQVLLDAYEKYHQRFKGNLPKPHALPKAA